MTSHLFSLFILFAQGSSAQEIIPTWCMDDLAKLSWSELECIYRQAPSGAMPCGYYKGKAIYCKGKLFSRVRSASTRLMWRGKHFSCARIVNQWSGMKTLDGKVYRACSWLDGKPSIMLDYRETSFIWRNIRDEIREVSPGVYIGIMFEEKKCEHKIRAFFILEAKCKGCGH